MMPVVLGPLVGRRRQQRRLLRKAAGMPNRSAKASQWMSRALVRQPLLLLPKESLLTHR